MTEAIEEKKIDKKHKVKLSDQGNFMPVDAPDGVIVHPTKPPPFPIDPPSTIGQKENPNVNGEIIRAAAIAKAEAEVWLKRQQEERDALQKHLDETLEALEAANKRGDNLQLELVDLQLAHEKLKQDCDAAREDARYAKSFIATVKHRALRQVEDMFDAMKPEEQP